MYVDAIGESRDNYAYMAGVEEEKVSMLLRMFAKDIDCQLIADIIDVPLPLVKEMAASYRLIR